MLPRVTPKMLAILGFPMTVLTFFGMRAAGIPSNWLQAAAWGLVCLIGLLGSAVWVVDRWKTWVSGLVQTATTEILKSLKGEAEARAAEVKTLIGTVEALRASFYILKDFLEAKRGEFKNPK